MSGGNIENIKTHMDSANLAFIKGSIVEGADVKKASEGVTTVFHFAAQPELRLSATIPMLDFRINMIGSMILLEAFREKGVNRVVFASSGGTAYR